MIDLRAIDLVARQNGAVGAQELNSGGRTHDRLFGIRSTEIIELGRPREAAHAHAHTIVSPGSHKGHICQSRSEGGAEMSMPDFIEPAIAYAVFTNK